MMEKTETPVVRHELFEYLARNPKALDAHAAWLDGGGEKLVDLALGAVRGDMFPWDREPHVQASFGAFCAGAAWMAKMLKSLVVMVNNRSEALRMLAQVDGQISAEERRILRENYGYSEQEILEYEKKAAAGKPAKKKQ